MTLYVSDTDVGEYALGAGVSVASDSGLLLAAASTASRAADEHCHRTFTVSDTTATAKVFEPLSSALCYVDDFHDTTDLIVKTDDDGDGVFETTWSANDYELAPLNGTTYTCIRAVGSHAFPTATDRRGVVQVTARWGWPEVPAMVRQACLELAKDAYRAHSATSGVLVDAGTGAMFTARTNRLAAAWLAPYVRHDRAGIA